MGKKAEEMSPERGSLGRGVTLIIYMLTALYSLPPPFLLTVPSESPSAHAPCNL